MIDNFFFHKAYNNRTVDLTQFRNSTVISIQDNNF